ncbi:hypothetical protein Tco_0037146, partial [Tanacetum coccineum]
MQETKAYKTYIGYAIGVTPPNKVRKFKKPTSPKLSTVPVSSEEPTRKSKRVKRHAKKSSNVPTTSVVIRDTSVMSSSKKKEKVTVEKCKGIKLLSEVTLTEEAQFEEVCKMSMRYFHKTHPSGSSIVTSAAKIKPFVTNEGTGAKPGVPDVTDEESTESDEDEGMDYTTNQFDDDMDLRMNEPVNIDEGFIQNEGTDSKMINVQQGNENPEILINQVIEDAHVTLSTVPKKTEVPVTRSSHSSDLASKFLIFLDIHHTNAKILSPMDVLVHHEVPSNQTITLLTIH